MLFWKKKKPAEPSLSPNTTAEELDRLFKDYVLAGSRQDRRLLPVLARHPNISPTLLSELATQCPQEAAQNPSLPLILLEQPDFFAKIRRHFLHNWLRNESTPLIFLQGLCLHPDLAIADAARRHVLVAGEAESGWHDDMYAYFRNQPMKNEWLLLEMAETVGPPDWVVIQLAGSRNGQIRAAALALPGMERLRSLVVRASGLKDVSRLGPAPCGRVSKAELSWLAEGPPFFQTLAARHPKTPPDFLEKLSRDPDGFLRIRVARNPSAPSDVLRKFASSPAEAERIAVLRNPACPIEILQTLKNDPSERVQTILTHRESAIKSGTSRRISRERRLPLRAVPSRHTALSDEERQALVKSPRFRDRVRAACDPFLSEEALYRLAGDPNGRVRRAARSRGGVREQTSRFGMPESLSQVIDAMTTTPFPGVLDLYAESAEFQLRLAALGNPALPENLIEQLTRDGNSWVRAAAQRRKATGKPLDLFGPVALQIMSRSDFVPKPPDAHVRVGG